MGDNTDHNTATLTGKGTFHCLDVIAVTEKMISGTDARIPHLKGPLKSDLMTGDYRNKIRNYNQRAKDLQSSLMMRSLNDLNFCRTLNTH